MTDIILTGAKYLIIILFAYFTYISFRAQRDVPDERKKLSFALQRITMLLIHALAFLSICIHIQLDSAIEMTLGQAIGLYAGQLVYLVVISCVIPHFAALSRGLNNVMCMFLTIGFIIQTRLDFSTSLRQFLIVVIGTIVFLMCIALCKRAKFMRNMTWIYGIIGMALLATVLVISRVVYGAKLAIDLGFFSFQPAEFVKILFVLFVASAFYRSNTRKTVLLTAICAAIHVLILVFCHDLGSALILFVIYVLMLYAATKKLVYVGISAAGLAAASFVAYKMFSHVRVRVAAWLDPWSTIDGNGYQIAQALFAIGTGGWFGSGLFGGKPKAVPVVSNDMIFSAISEEMGGLFSLILILLCLCFVLMIFRVAMRVNNAFYKLLAFGLGCAYGFQVFLTIGGTIKFIPLTGVNLPFISSGGSSILASLIMLGMVQALYVISEADVEREREMVAAGVLTRKPEEEAETIEVRRRAPEEEEEIRRPKKKVREVPDEYEYEEYQELVRQRERIREYYDDYELDEYDEAEEYISQRDRIREIHDDYDSEAYDDPERPVRQKDRIKEIHDDYEPEEYDEPEVFIRQKKRIREIPDEAKSQRERIKEVLPEEDLMIQEKRSRKRKR